MKNRIILKRLRYAMLGAILMTGSPLILIANRIEPTVFGMPFFLVWSMVPTLLLFGLSIWYSKIADKMENEGEDV